jgi:2-oxoglutarate dehydrogenase E2 component (dihydrolipoamide succinyltransferase)
MTVKSEIRAPVEQEGSRTVVRRWLKAVGDPVRLDEPVVELETDKVAVEVAAEAEGVLAEILLDAGAGAEPGAVLGRLAASEAVAARPTAQVRPVEPAATTAPSQVGSFDPALRLSPAVRRRLVEAGLDPTGLQGKGRDGRLTLEDVEQAIVRRGEAAPSSATAGVVTISHDSMRLAIAEHLSRSVAVAPHVTAVFEADFGAVSAHRLAHKDQFQRRGASLTYTAYILAACAEAMKAAPQVNSRWFDDRLELYADVNIGVGVSLGDKGLIVPVVQRVQALSLFEIARRLDELTAGARAGKLSPADVRGGTFSISNHGMTGSLVAAPVIINQPQSAILGVGKIEKRVVVREAAGGDAIQIRPMAYVTLTIDHRAIDGHQTNAWLSRFVETIEGWA